MRLQDIIRSLHCEVLEGGPDFVSAEIDCCFAADLMSDVLAFSGPGGLLITGLTNIQSIHTADIADLRAILFVNGKKPEAPVVELAHQRGLPLLSTALPMFSACGILHGHGLEASTK